MMKNNNIKLCEICGIEASSLCLQCISYFCDDCFKYVHDKKINLNHKKENIDYFIQIDTKCPDHPKIPITLFCVDEKGKIYLYNIYIKWKTYYYRTLLFKLPF